MATKGGGDAAGKTRARAALRGRFRPGSRVRLFECKIPEQLRPHEEQEPVGEAVVDGEGLLVFDEGVKEGQRYIASGYVDGFPLDVRVTGKAAREAETDVQGRIEQDPVRTRGGQLLPERGQPLVSPVVRAPHDQAKRDAIAASKKAAEKSAAKSTSKKAPARKSAAKGGK